MLNQQIKSKVTKYSISVGNKVKVTVDKKSGARIINFPFEFPDETKGVLIIVRAINDEWEPYKDIKDITINFNLI